MQIDRSDPCALVAYQRAEHERAKNLHSTASAADWILLIIAILGVWLTAASVYLAAASFLIGFVRLVLIGIASESCNVADRARRAVLILDGLGIAPTEKEFTDIYDAFHVTEADAEKHWDAAYYATGESRGPARLAALLEESAFWSKALYRVAARESWIRFGGAVVLAMIAFTLVVDGAAQGNHAPAVEVFYIVIATLVTGGAFMRAIEYSDATQKLDDVENRIPKNPTEVVEILPALGDYNAVVQRCRSVPSRIYLKHRDRLNRLWEARKGARNGDSQGASEA